MISMVLPLAIGNALRLFIQPPAGAARWRILRKGADSFSGPDDESARVAYEGDDRVIVDHQALPNEQMAFYKPYYADTDGVWIAGPTAYGTPVASYEDSSTDVLGIMRDRLEAGLRVEVERGNINNSLGYVQVFTAPPLIEANLQLPCVSLHLASEKPAERAIGEDAFGDQFDAIGFEWAETEGYLADVRLEFGVYSLNPDERVEMRKAIRRVVVGNLPVFSAEGMDLMTPDFSDTEELSGEQTAPLFQVVGSFSCVAPVRVGSMKPAVRDTSVTATPIGA